MLADWLEGRPRAPWITEDGYLNLTRVPIERVLRQSVSADDNEFELVCRTGGNVRTRPDGGGCIFDQALLPLASQYTPSYQHRSSEQFLPFLSIP